MALACIGCLPFANDWTTKCQGTWSWNIMRCASMNRKTQILPFHIRSKPFGLCTRLSIARISARLALAFLSSAWSSFLRVHNLRATLYSNITRLWPTQTQNGKGSLVPLCLIHSLQTSFQIRNLPSHDSTAYHPLLLCSLSGFTSPFARSLQPSQPVPKGKGSRWKSIW